MKNISKILLGFGLIFITACNTDDSKDFTLSTKPVVSNVGMTSFSFTEGDGTTATIQLSIDKAIAQPIILALNPSNPNGAITADDYELSDSVTDYSTFIGPNFFTGMTTETSGVGGYSGKGVVIPPYTTSYSFQITAAADLLTEVLENETLELIPFASRNALVANGKVVYDLSITNLGVMTMDFSWDNDGPVSLFGSDYPICPNTDLDFYIAPAVGFDINNPFANEVGNYDAATGACPEQIILSEGDLPDGDYVIFTDLWSNAFAGFGAPNSMAVHATFTKLGAFQETVVQDATQAYTIDTPAGSFNGVVANVNIAGGIFTISEYNGTVVASGRQAVNTVNTPQEVVNNKAPRAKGLVK